MKKGYDGAGFHQRTMKNNRPLYIGLAALIAAVALGVSAWIATDVRDAPEVHFTVIDGRNLYLSDLRGKPVLLTFWATWCKPCLEEEPSLAALYTELHPHGLELIAVGLNEDTPARIDDFRRRYRVPYPIALDLDGSIARAFGVDAIPRTFVIAPDGRILYDHTGALKVSAVKAALARMNER